VSSLHSLYLLAQAATPTPDVLDVRLVDDGQAAWWHVPAISGVAALLASAGGVAIGGWMNRRTLRHAEQRKAVGAMRLAIAELEERRYRFRNTLARGSWWSGGGDIASRSQIRADETHMLCTWATHQGWSRYYLCQIHYENLERRRRSEESLDEDERDRIAKHHAILIETIAALQDDVTRLSGEIGQEVPSWTRPPPLPPEPVRGSQPAEGQP
jgi:hypothetical protein